MDKSNITPLEGALKAVQIGINVFPVHGIMDRQCTCGDSECKKPGKHPNGSWTTLKTTDEDQIRQWAVQYPYGNFGWSMEGLLAVDVDIKKGKNGFESLKSLPVLPPTLQIRTGGGGEHHIYKNSGLNVTNSVDELGNGLDIRTDGGLLVGAGSLHVSGNRYEVINDVEIAEAPGWLLDKLTKKSKPSEASLTFGSNEKSSTGSTRNFEWIEAGCVWMQHIREDATTLSEPEWKLACTIISRCDNGPKLFHELSKPYPKYDQGETDTKIDQSLSSGGPARCDVINSEHCEGCIFKGRIKSPITLGQSIFHKFRDWAYLAFLDRFVNLRTGEILKRGPFGERYRSLCGGKVASTVFNSSTVTTKIDRQVCRPRQERLILEDGRLILNSWLPSDVVPVKGDAGVFFDHLAYLIPKDQELKCLIDVLAYIVQRPEGLMGYMTLIKGQQGTGKSVLGGVLTSILGELNVRPIGSDDLKDKWAGWLENKVLIIIEELMMPGRLEAMNSLKTKITDLRVSIERKGLDSYVVDNVAKFVAFTNEDGSACIKEGDRRVFYLDSPATPRPKQYYEMLHTWITENIGVIYQALLDHDLSNFSPMDHAPMTDAKRQLIEDSRPALDATILEMIQDGLPPFDKDLVKADEIGRQLLRTTIGKVSDRKITSALRRLNIVRAEQKILPVSNKRPRLWVVRNQDDWVQNTCGKWDIKDPEAVEAHISSYSGWQLGGGQPETDKAVVFH